MTEDREFIEDLDSLPLAGPAPFAPVPLSGARLSHQHYHQPRLSLLLYLLPGPSHGGQKIRKRSAALIVDEIEHILSYGINRITWPTTCLPPTRPTVKEVCGEIQKRGLSFTGAPLRGSIRLTGETLQTMKDTGCDSVSLASNQEIRRCSSGSGKK